MNTIRSFVLNVSDNFKVGTSTMYNGVSMVCKYPPSLYDLSVKTFRALGLGLGITFAGKTLGLDMSYSTMVIFAWEYSSFFTEAYLRKLGEDQNKKRVVMYCTASKDFTGACGVSIFSLITLQKLSKTCSIFSQKFNDLKDINNAIQLLKEQGKKISILWLSAHGSNVEIESQSRIVGNQAKGRWDWLWNKFPGNKKVEFIKNLLFNELEEDAEVILSCCYVGKPSKEPNFAEYVQYYAGPKRKIHAPTDQTGGGRFDANTSENGAPKVSGDFYFNKFYLTKNTAKISYQVAKEKIEKHPTSGSHQSINPYFLYTTAGLLVLCKLNFS